MVSNSDIVSRKYMFYIKLKIVNFPAVKTLLNISSILIVCVSKLIKIKKK